MPELTTIISSVENANEFQQLGDRVPTPPLNINTEYHQGVDRDIHVIELERKSLKETQIALVLRAKFVILARDRQRRVTEEIRMEPDFTPKTGRDICGFDSRLVMENEVFQEWSATSNAANIFENSKIEGRNDMCLKKKCERHRGWLKVQEEDVAHRQGIVLETLLRLDVDEARIRERRKERALETGQEGFNHVDILT